MGSLRNLTPDRFPGRAYAGAVRLTTSTVGGHNQLFMPQLMGELFNKIRHFLRRNVARICVCTDDLTNRRKAGASTRDRRNTAQMHLAATLRVLHIAEIDCEIAGFIAVTRPPVRVDAQLGQISRTVVEWQTRITVAITGESGDD